MTGSSRFVAVAVVLALVGAALFGAAQYDRAIARAQRHFAAERYADAEAELEAVDRYLQYGAWLPWTARALDDVRTRRAAARYWSRAYDQILADQQASADAAITDVQLIAANATFRRGQAQSLDKQRTLDALQTATSAYLGVLRDASPDRAQAMAIAAYNYEYVTRTREDVDRGRRAPELSDTAEDGPAGKKGGQLPDPPERENMKTLVPLEPGEMDQGVEPGQGGRIERKG